MLNNGKIFVLKYSSAYLFRAAISRLIVALHKDVLFHYKKSNNIDKRLPS
jgi:hypothetical protein